MGNQRETLETLQEHVLQKFGLKTFGFWEKNTKTLNLSKRGEMSSISLALESETEHVAEWIVLAGNPASSLRWIVARLKTHGCGCGGCGGYGGV